MSHRVLVRYNTTKGIRNAPDYIRAEVPNNSNITINSLIQGTNIDIDDTGKPSRRYGRELLIPGSFHSLSNELGIVAKDNILQRIERNGNTVTLYPIINSPTVYDRTSYWLINNQIYVTDRYSIGYIENGIYYNMPAVDANLDGYPTEIVQLISVTRSLLPAGHLIAYYMGRVFVAVGSVLYYSDAMAFHRCFLEASFIQFNDTITLVAPTDDGIWVSADKTYFLAGKDPEQFELIKKGEDKAKMYSQQVLPDTMINPYALEISGILNIWVSDLGLRVGGEKGQLRIISDNHFIMPQGTVGTSLIRKYTKPLLNGNTTLINQYICTLKN